LNFMKKIISLILLICLCLSFFGCDNEAVPQIVTTPPPTPCAHSETEWIVSIYPSKAAEGKEYEKCLICKEKLQTRAIEKLPCSHENVWLEKVKTPTENELGLNKIICVSCDEELGTEPIYSKAQISAKLSNSVFKVYAYDYSPKDHYIEHQGTGFFIDEAGTFITNAHVVENCTEIKILFNGKKYQVEKPLYYDKTNSDIVFLRVKGNFKSEPVEFSNDVKRDDVIYALGYPNDAPEMQTSAGKVISEAYIVEGVAYYLFNAEVDHGSSGGILCDRFGNVIGVVTLGWEDGINGALIFRFFEHLVENFKVK